MTYMKNYLEYLADTELKRANGLHPAFASAHEGWAVLLEEIRKLSSETHAIEEMHQLVFTDVMQDRSARDGIACVYETAIRAACEAVQVAAMAKKFIAMEESQHEQALR